MVEASKWKVYKAKHKAITELRGSVVGHYGKLRSYILELQKVDKEGRFVLNCDIGSVFKGLYIGFSSLKKGFKLGCRRLIGLDGAFLKTYLGGVLWCVTGSDGNVPLCLGCRRHDFYIVAKYRQTYSLTDSST